MFKRKIKNSLDFLNISAKVKEGIPLVKKIKQERKFIKYIKYLCYGILGIVCFLILILLLNIFSIKNIFSNSLIGKNLLFDAVNSIKSNNYALAVEQTNSAKKYLNEAQKEVGKMDHRYFLSSIPVVNSLFNDGKALVEILANLNLVANESTLLAADIQAKLGKDKNYSYDKFSEDERRYILNKLNSSTSKLIEIKIALDNVLVNINDLDTNGLWRPFKNRIDEFDQLITAADRAMDNLIPLTQILPKLSGYPKKSVFLVMLQNNDELRPSGGFLGTYGILEIESGDIKRFDTHDIYHMDMPSQDKTNETPPAPIKKYLNEKWYMRDANWSPDWPSAAQKIEYFYYLENQYLTGKNDINKFSGNIHNIQDPYTSDYQ